MISIDIPKNGSIIDLNKELALARNIKDKKNMKNVMIGLQKIKDYA